MAPVAPVSGIDRSERAPHVGAGLAQASSPSTPAASAPASHAARSR
jgi:hypothetical protein